MTVVVDLGCETQQGEASIGPLIERFQPVMLYGFDPLAKPASYTLNGTDVVVRADIAWTCDGKTAFSRGAAIDSTAMPTSTRWRRSSGLRRCFDFSAWLARHGPAVVKMDIEGAEFPVLEKMMEDGTDGLVELLLIEWHHRFLPGHDPDDLTERLACEVEAWH